MLERELDRGTDVAFQAANVTVVHFQRIAGVISAALTRSVQEVKDLAWDYQGLAGELRQSGLADVGHIDLGRTATGRRGWTES